MTFDTILNQLAGACASSFTSVHLWVCLCVHACAPPMSYEALSHYLSHELYTHIAMQWLQSC